MNDRHKKTVYLIGAGAIQDEMAHEGNESDIRMRGISENVFEMSKRSEGEYYKLLEKFGIPKNQGVELMMSLFDSFTASRNANSNEKKQWRREILSGKSYLGSGFAGILSRFSICLANVFAAPVR